MLKTRIILVVVSAIVIVLIFLLPKVVVENDERGPAADDAPGSRNQAKSDIHTQAPQKVLNKIAGLRQKYKDTGRNEKNAIFADSLTSLYAEAGKFDSAAWFAEEAAKFFNTTESWIKAGDNYYQAYTFALDTDKQNGLAAKAQEIYGQVLEKEPKNLTVKTKLAMTYFTSASPMQGVKMLREVLEEDPKNELALFNLGVLSIQSGQYDKAIDRLKELVEINPAHTQAQLFLGVALMEKGDKTAAKKQFQKVKDMDKDPSVQATVDSYLKDLN